MESCLNNSCKQNLTKNGNMWAILGGALAGFINGIFGGGGGMIIVPLLTLILKYNPKKAHATAILIILPLSLISGLLYSYFKMLGISLLLPVSIGVSVGGVVGAILLSKLSSKWIVLIFSIVMDVAGVKMIFF